MTVIHGQNQRVRLDISDGIAEIRMVHPEKRNCFSLPLTEDFSELLTEVDDREDEISVILITAEGPVFSAGADVDILANGTERERNTLSNMLVHEVCHPLHQSLTPVIAAARGAAAGGGATLLCYSADMRIASPDLEIWWPEVQYGIAPLGRTVYLANEIGAARALELMLLGEHQKLNANEAKELGLINHITDSSRVDQKARAMAEIITEHDQEFNIVHDFMEVIHRGRDEASGASQAHAQWKEVSRKQ